MNKRKYILMATALLVISFSLSGCGKKSSLDIEDEVARNLEKIGQEKEQSDDDTVTELTLDIVSDSDEKTSKDTDIAAEIEVDNNSDSEGGSQEIENHAGRVLIYNENPFVGYNSTSTEYDINFTIQTDSGIAGFVWGYDDSGDEESDYYLWAIDLTRDIPRLYTSRRQESAVWDEEYTNLDIMYPEKDMFTGSSHIIEIRVKDNKAVTCVDSYQIAETTLSNVKTIGQIGTWVMEGDYHASFDDIKVYEGADCNGDYLYVEDFSGVASIIPDKKGPQNGVFVASPGLMTVPRK